MTHSMAAASIALLPTSIPSASHPACISSSAARATGSPRASVRVCGGRRRDTEVVRAQIGADDLELFQEAMPELLQVVSGIRPEPPGLHVLLEQRGVSATQRL